MTASVRRWALGSVLVVGVCWAAGCNPLAMPFYIFGPEPKNEAGLKRLSSDDKKKEIRVAVLTYNNLEIRPELIQADRQLSDLLAKKIKSQSEYNKEKVSVVPLRKVEEFKSTHPGWHELDLTEVGRNLKADYLVYLEINSLSLYEKGSHNQMYRGRISLRVSVVNVNRPDDSPLAQDYSYVYPNEAKGPLAVDADAQPIEFRQAFLAYVAQRLSWLFVAHPQEDDMSME